MESATGITYKNLVFDHAGIKNVSWRVRTLKKNFQAMLFILQNLL